MGSANETFQIVEKAKCARRHGEGRALTHQSLRSVWRGTWGTVVGSGILTPARKQKRNINDCTLITVEL